MFNRTIGLILLIALAAGLGLFAAQRFFAAPSPEQGGWPQTRTATMYPAPRPIENFSLRQADGTELTLEELQGHWTLVFLGFTFCPDVCPTTLAELAKAQTQWEALPLRTRPRVLLVSVDPQRDTPELLHGYARGFHADTLSATADPEVLEDFATSIGFVFMKVPGPNVEQNPNDYTMDHSSGIALLDPQGRVAGLIRAPLDPALIAADMMALREASIP